jgi:hypothetical protein
MAAALSGAKVGTGRQQRGPVMGFEGKPLGLPIPPCRAGGDLRLRAEPAVVSFIVVACVLFVYIGTSRCRDDFVLFLTHTHTHTLTYIYALPTPPLTH